MTAFDVPLSRKRTCVYCSVQIDSNGQGVFQLASGWLENRKRGGANTIACPKRQDVYSCHDCIDRLRAGISVGQQRLFSVEGYDA